MRITGISTHVVGTPWRNLTYVRVHTDEGLTGVGETRMLGRTNALVGYLEEASANHITGSDPFAVEDLVRRMKYGDYGRAGEIVMSGIAVVEMACWDIKGKALGVPVWQLLGGKVTDRVKAYANGWYTTERTPEAYHEAARAVVGRGYRALKIDPFGTGHLELGQEETRYAVSLIEAVRDAIGPDTELMLEMHGRFSPATAVRIAREMAPFAPAWLEEPVPPENLKALAKVAEKVDQPIATGERVHDRIEFRELFESQAADIIQPDVGHIGGILEARKLAATAETHYVMVAPHNVGGSVLTAANLQLAGCTPNFKILEHFNDFADADIKKVVKGAPQVDPATGCFTLSDAPGLGVELDVEAAAEFPQQQARFDLWAEGWEKRQPK
ncbi:MULTISPECIES: mandelate racemase/muconate lactonizing enzyme family protein [unclassified Streptomyces]|uniref:mandelate racemase/muconate lactonizing enzyme family protein n=1 Tax=unclassified Streptomyces TaxID=2593676 RepID=UPI0001C18A3A|nr:MULTISPECIES: mandelate racemase/muconate lactonizing enzyme family protein [unclassified Streptomyces]MYR64761.1 mandelate racemase/muconate lactonizing enzyme family protein [Streptomyces sp. SID4939]MYS01521.1 mandelate racemase/muconate lactonizing enzyme family protein [Streptomyces sp. SID4940]MYT64341.1 mandelate racemase/muconate lactonizing enzyme family protein [Streptomyces sp. SID8357]MYT87154.1 mandelate racemase/muconate lactonizing enzyme family protein [Streptomyces sp. SID83